MTAAAIALAACLSATGYADPPAGPALAVYIVCARELALEGAAHPPPAEAEREGEAAP